MSTPLRNFDMQGLHAALYASRLARGLSWAALVAEINKPFEGTPSIPISVSTVRGIGKKSSVTSAVVLQIFRWLGRTPESFLLGSDAAPQASEILRDPGPSRILLRYPCTTRRARRGTPQAGNQVETSCR